jgi:glycosyltransferase involved in cell wall biosynthesis
MKFSCLIPVFNTNPSQLFECLDSLVHQTLPADEIVVIDDGSTSRATIDALDAAIGIYGISLFRFDTNHGTSVALNEGHKLCKHEWVAISGSDDISYPERFEKQVDFIRSNPDAKIVGTALFSFREGDPTRKQIHLLRHRPIWHQPGFPDKRVFCINHGTAMYRKSLMLEFPYDHAYRREQDVHLWARILRAGHTFHNLPDVLYAWRYRH